MRFSLTRTRSIKNLIKLQGGEYIALEHLEATYKSCNLVSNLCVHATPDATQPIAIIVPHEGHLRAALSDDQDAQTAPLADLCRKPKVRALILKECNAVGKKGGFKSIEMLQAVVLTAHEWTPESGLVTAAQKIQRRKVAQAFDAEIKVRFWLFWADCALMLIASVVGGVRSKEVKVVRYTYGHAVMTLWFLQLRPTDGFILVLFRPYVRQLFAQINGWLVCHPPHGSDTLHLLTRI